MPCASHAAALAQAALRAKAFRSADRARVARPRPVAGQEFESVMGSDFKRAIVSFSGTP